MPAARFYNCGIEVVLSGEAYPVGRAVQSALGSWITVAAPPAAERVADLRKTYGLDAGESEAILVAEALGNTAVLMDERRGVQCARSRGIFVIRILLIYANAKLLGLIGSVQGKLDELRSRGFRLSDSHYRQILESLGEG